MAKKIVSGITDVKNITKQDFDTNNVNDLLSDGEHAYIHRKKKDNSEEYHCLTDNIKTIKSGDAGLLSVTNNTASNTATLTVKHDTTKQGTLTPGYGIKIDEGNTITAPVPTKVNDAFDLNTLTEGVVKGQKLTNAPDQFFWVVTAYSEGNYAIQEAFKFVTTGKYVEKRVRYKQGQTWTEWVDTVPDSTSNVVLTSPNGTTYNVTVTDEGVLQTTLVSATALVIPLEE